MSFGPTQKLMMSAVMHAPPARNEIYRNRLKTWICPASGSRRK
jgi:hypothetical protein